MNILNLFRNSEKETEESQTFTVEEIHSAFLTASDMFEEQNLKRKAENHYNHNERVDILVKLGFKSVDEVFKKSSTDTQYEKVLCEAILYFRIKYPNYKFICNEHVNILCKKYNLLLGGVHQYVGFVPDKNVKEMTKFFELYQYEQIDYMEEHHPEKGEYLFFSIDKKQYEKNVNNHKTSGSGYLFQKNILDPIFKYGYYKNSLIGYKCYQNDLRICAPRNEMNTKIHNSNIREPLDPIVLLPKRYANIQGYLIITAWGDEASDELVVNQLLN